MDSFYIFLLLALPLGTTIGYYAGFARIVFFCVEIIAATSAAFFLYLHLENVVSVNFPALAEWIIPLSFSFTFLACFGLFHFVISRFTNGIEKVKKNVFNRVMGGLVGIAGAGMLILTMDHFTDVLVIPENVDASIDHKSLNNLFDNAAGFANSQFVPIFQKQTAKVMASDNEDAVSHDAVMLPYTTNFFELRPDLEIEMLDLINIERKKYGLKMLVNDVALGKVARAHSADMFKRGYFSHNTPEGIDPFERLRAANIRYRFAGENLALAPTLAKAYDELLKSPGHRANILNSSYGRVGIGILQAGAHGLMVTQAFRD